MLGDEVVALMDCVLLVGVRATVYLMIFML
jgi:hypothetical protein